MSGRDLGWARHALGFERLLDIRGPAAFMSLPELMVMERTRASIILASHVYRRPTILARPEWKSVPWVLYPERKNSMQMLLDILADCPALLPVRDTLASGAKMGQLKEYEELAETTQSILTRLDHFEQNWRTSNPSATWEVPLLEPQSSQTPEEAGDRPWTSVLRYRSLADADIVMMANAMRIMLHTFVRGLPCPWSSQFQEQMRQKCIDAAMIICRSMEYEIQEINKGASNHLLYWPTKIAFDVLGCEYPSIGLWLEGILTGMAEGWTGKIGALMRGLRENA
jgi:hypothetical protein